MTEEFRTTLAGIPKALEEEALTECLVVGRTFEGGTLSVDSDLTYNQGVALLTDALRDMQTMGLRYARKMRRGCDHRRTHWR